MIVLHVGEIIRAAFVYRSIDKISTCSNSMKLRLADEAKDFSHYIK